MRQRELYTLSKRIRKINRADQELWMRGVIIYPLIIGLSCMDGVTLYEVFFKMTESAEKEARYLLTVGIAVVLNFIPLVVGRYIHYHRYGMNGVKLWMIVGLVIVFLLLFFATFYLRWETRGMDGAANVFAKGSILPETEANPEAETAFTLVMGIIPLVTSAVNLALGYVISDPIKRRLDTLRYQSALLKEQVNRLYAAECELNRNWENALPETETERLKAAKGTIQADSDRIKKWARLALAKKLGDAESISELTDT